MKGTPIFSGHLFFGAGQGGPTRRVSSKELVDHTVLGFRSPLQEG